MKGVKVDLHVNPAIWSVAQPHRRIPIRQEVNKTIGNHHAMPHPVTKQTLDQLTLGRELRRKLPESLVPTKEVASGQIQS